MLDIICIILMIIFITGIVIITIDLNNGDDDNE